MWCVVFKFALFFLDYWSNWWYWCQTLSRLDWNNFTWPQQCAEVTQTQFSNNLWNLFESIWSRMKEFGHRMMMLHRFFVACTRFAVHNLFITSVLLRLNLVVGTCKLSTAKVLSRSEEKLQETGKHSYIFGHILKWPRTKKCEDDVTWCSFLYGSLSMR